MVPPIIDYSDPEAIIAFLCWASSSSAAAAPTVALPEVFQVNEATSVLRVLAIAVVLEVSFVWSAKSADIIDLIFFSDGEPPSFRLRFLSNGLASPLSLTFYSPPRMVATIGC